jgi:heterodisulfide reductase subunit A
MAKIGLYLCECGPNIAEAINLDEITEAVKKDNKVAGIERHKLLCSNDGKNFLAETIKKNKFERVVIAACSPKQHEGTFMEVLSKANLNPYMFQLVNIREQCAWVTPDKNAATRKALSTIRAAINRVKHHIALEKKEIECDPNVIVIGRGIAAIEAALRTAHNDRKVFLIVEDGEAGGTLKNHRMLLPSMQSAEEFLKTKIDALKNNKSIEIFENSKIKEILGFFGNFVANIQTKENKNIELNAGSVILALEAESFIPEDLINFGYGKFDKVYTAAEFEKMDIDKANLKSVAIIHCVGRNKLGYCSKFCCTNSIKIARYIKEKASETKVTQFYKDLCLPDKKASNLLGLKTSR